MNDYIHLPYAIRPYCYNRSQISSFKICDTQFSLAQIQQFASDEIYSLVSTHRPMNSDLALLLKALHLTAGHVFSSTQADTRCSRTNLVFTTVCMNRVWQGSKVHFNAAYDFQTRLQKQRIHLGQFYRVSQKFVSLSLTVSRRSLDLHRVRRCGGLHHVCKPQ